MSLKNYKYNLRWFIISIVIVAVDLYTKALVVKDIKFGEVIRVFPGFNLTHLYNYGAAFSFLDNKDSTWQLMFFSVISLIVSLSLIYLILKQEKKDKLTSIAFALVLGGAIGNLYERFFQGFVVDFLDVYVGSYHWPSFNVADSAVSVGLAIYLIHIFLFQNKNK